MHVFWRKATGAEFLLDGICLYIIFYGRAAAGRAVGGRAAAAEPRRSAGLGKAGRFLAPDLHQALGPQALGMSTP